MRKRLLGRTGLYVSELCCGTATFGGLDQFKISGEVNQKEADAIVGMLTGKYRRGQPWPTGTRLPAPDDTDHWPFEPEKLYPVIDELDKIALEHSCSVSQVALNYLLQKPGVCSLIIGTRKLSQLQENLKAMEWQITPEEVARLDKVSEPKHMYPYELPPSPPPKSS